MSNITFYKNRPITSYADLFDRLFDFNENYEIRTNVNETDENYILNLIVPGFEKTDFEIGVDKNTLSIETNEIKKIGGISYDKIKKKYELPNDSDKEKIVSSLISGILTITIPKLEKSIVTKKIEIQ